MARKLMLQTIPLPCFRQICYRFPLNLLVFLGRGTIQAARKYERGTCQEWTVSMIASLAFLILTTNTIQTSTASGDLTPEEKVRGLSLFWKEAADHFVFFDKLKDLNWD